MHAACNIHATHMLHACSIHAQGMAHFEKAAWRVRVCDMQKQRPCSIHATPLQLLPFNTLATPFQHPCNTPSTTPPCNAMQCPCTIHAYPCDTHATSVQHLCNARATSIQHPCNTHATPTQHPRNTHTTPMKRPCNTSARHSSLLIGHNYSGATTP